MLGNPFISLALLKESKNWQNNFEEFYHWNSLFPSTIKIPLFSFNLQISNFVYKNLKFMRKQISIKTNIKIETIWLNI